MVDAGKISIHALREEGDCCFRLSSFFFVTISIHALREEGDQTISGQIEAAEQFLSTPSARRATCFGKRGAHAIPISIHALREEGDPRRSGPV